ncbi:MAG TPA: translation initiation factor IF-2 [Lacipirellulaceae bacterium]|nr:translation initiation factor IF-2 [Lacipirellulaceae bacterium]
MAVRIYALAKELKLDSKELVDICTRAGVPGKGSALASLTEDEVEKVKQFLKGDGLKTKPGKAAPPPPQRPSEPTRPGKMPVIVTAKPPVAPSRPKPVEPAPEPVASESTLAATSTATETSSATAVAVETARRPGPLAGAMGREMYIGPAGHVGGKVPVVGKESRPAERKKTDGGTATTERARPAVKLAPLPKSSRPIEPVAPDEPPAQKPDLRLPPDLLGAGKQGSKPLAAHLRRHERTLDEEKKQRGVKGPRLPLAPVPEEESRRTAKAKGRRGKETPPDGEGEGDRPMLGGREQRQLARRRNATQVDTEDRPHRSLHRRQRRVVTGSTTTAPRKERVAVQLPCSVRELSEAAGVQASEIQRILMNAGLMTTINSVMDPEMTQLVAGELGINVEFKQAVSLEEQLLADLQQQEDDPEQLVERPPVITFLGHVDHGKTSLLDRIIGIDVVSGESGGITQHIRAYTIDKDGRRISFVDTPGHEAFTEMRARGANVTDIAVLVVAADDGVMPQTEEAISHARAAEVPIVVALNKIDLPGINIERVYQGLSTNELLPSEWGGDVEVVKTSATKGTGIDELLETLLTVAELHEYKANPNRPAVGTCLEAQQEAERGIVAKVLVQNGTLNVGDIVVCGQAHGRVKAMYDTLDDGRRLASAGPSEPVNITGLDVAPSAGSRFYVLDDIARAREVARSRAEQERTMTLGASGFRHVTLESLFDRLDPTGEAQTLNIILRADVRGSIEAIEKEFSKLEHPEVRVKLLQKSVGGITEADVTLAHASDAIIIGFNVVPDEKARTMAERTGVQIRRYDVIYKITDDLRLALEGMLKPEEREVELGRALVQQIFKISRVGTVAGCRVLSGVVERNSRARVIRDSTIIGDYALDTLRREKDDAREVREGYECGIKLAGFNDIKEGDLFEIYKVEEIHRKFE